MRKFQRIGALWMALIMLVLMVPAGAEALTADPPAAVEEIISETPTSSDAALPDAVSTEAPTQTAEETPSPTVETTEAPVFTTEAPTDAPATEVPTENAPETSNEVENPTETPENNENEIENPTEEPKETETVTENPTETPETTPEPEPTPTAAAETAFQPGLATLRAGARLYANANLFGEAEITESTGVVYAQMRADNEKAIRVALYDGQTVRTGWVAASSLSMLTAEETAAYDAQPRTDEDDVMVAHGHLLEAIGVHPEEQVTEAPTNEPETTEIPTIEPTEAPTNEPEVTEAPTTEPTEVPTNEPEVTEAPTTEPTEAPTNEPEITEAPTTEPETTEAPDEIISDELPPTTAPEATATAHPEAPTTEPTDEPVIELPTDDLDKLVIGRALEQPTGLSASYERSGRITLTWMPVEGANAYAVYYKPAGGSTYTLLGQSSTTSLSTTKPQMGLVYYYRVQALYQVGGETVSRGEESLTYTYIALGDVVIADPRGKDSTTIRLNWTKVSGATHYDVMMSLHDANDYKIVRTDLTGSLCDVSNLSFNETYDFLIVPKRKLNDGTVITGLPSRVRMVGSPMERTTFTDYEWTASGLKLSWQATSGAMGYVIYRRGFHETDYHKLVVTENTNTSFVDTTMKPGEVYYYFVYAYRLAQPQGWRCFSLKGDIGMGVWLPQTTGLTAVSAQENSVRISWTATEGANRYDVYISSTPGGTPKANGRLSNAYGYHNSAVLGKTYYYRVRPVRVFSNGDISVGTWSEELTFTHQEAVGRYRALLIGNTYAGESNELLGCDNDVDGMRTMLSRMTATPYSVTVKKNIRAEEILSSISSTFGDANYNDVSLFYYAGHGANSVEADGTPTNYHAALVGTFQTYVSISRLKTELDKIPGKKILIIDACHSGQFISRDGTTTTVSASAFNSQVINLFANEAQLTQSLNRSTTVVLGEDGQELLEAEAPVLLERDSNVNFASGGYYVITACRSTEKSVSTGYDSNGDGKIDRYFGLFTYGLCYGNGWNLAKNTAIGSLAADLNQDNQITLYEAYVYAKVMAQSHNPGQTAQIWPENSALVLWGK